MRGDLGILLTSSEESRLPVQLGLQPYTQPLRQNLRSKLGAVSPTKCLLPP
jgi:hypothetical protein